MCRCFCGLSIGIPKGFCPPAQGWPRPAGTTLGNDPIPNTTPTGLCPNESALGNEAVATPLGLNDFLDWIPRVVQQKPGQPWAGGHNPVGIVWNYAHIHSLV